MSFWAIAEIDDKISAIHGSVALCVIARVERASTSLDSLNHDRAKNSVAPSLKKRKKTALMGTP